ncbi:hypothetical protein H0H92_011450 [Tricholoma furcatifolium]|nr:hypothetical protein H0H92_011450 [Tricholoma furcatifolium]
MSCSGLKFRLAAHEAGIDINPNATYLASERLSLLDRVENGWANLNFDFVKIIPILHGASSLYTLTGDVLVLGDRKNRRILHHVTIPSREGGEELKWKKIDVGSRVINFGLSIYEHDLIAVVTLSEVLPHGNTTQIRLIQFSTGRPHPLAQKPIVTVDSEAPRWRDTLAIIEISGDHVVVTLNGRLYILEWRTGIPKLDNRIRNMYTSFVFLSPTILCIPNRWAGTLDIWHIPNEPVTSASPKPFLYLALPAHSPSIPITHIACRGEPNPSPNGTPHSTHAFHPSSEDAIIPFTIFFHVSTSDNYGVYMMYIHRRSLLELSLSRVSEVVPWEKWGPQRTRWFHYPDRTARWVSRAAATGQRAVVLSNLDEYEADGQDDAEKGDGDTDKDKDKEVEVDQSNPEPTQRVTVLDFNPNSLAKKRMNTSVGPRPLTRVVDKKTGLRTKHFLHPVESSLPYASQKIDLIDGPWDGLLMDKERLIGVKLNPENRFSLLQTYHIGDSRE